MIRGQISSKVKLVWIQGFSSPTLVSKQNLEKPVCLTIFLYIGREWMDICLSNEHYRELKHKQPRPGFELESWILSLAINITLIVTPENFWVHLEKSRKHVFAQTLHWEQDVTQGQFLSGVKLVWFKNFLSTRLVSLSLVNTFCLQDESKLHTMRRLQFLISRVWKITFSLPFLPVTHRPGVIALLSVPLIDLFENC